MKKIIINFLPILAITVVLSGCSKDFLKSEIPGKLPTEDFFKTDGDAIQGTTSIYDMMQSDQISDLDGLHLVKVLLSDESNASGDGPGDIPSLQTLDDFNFDSENDAVLAGWKLCYGAINRANQVINKVSPDNDLRKRLIAEAKALRAYNFFDLVSLWGDVPIILDELTPDEYSQQSRAPKSEVYAQIEKDLLEAIPDLPLKSGYGGEDKFRVSKGTAQAILGKAYLYQEKWEEAAVQFNEVIVSMEYDLELDLGFLFSHNGEFGKESLFESSYAMEVNSQGGRASERNLSIYLMGPNGEYYQKAPGDSLLSGWGFNTPTDKLFQAFVSAGDTYRRQRTIMSIAELQAGGGDWTAPDYYDYEGYFSRKYAEFEGEKLPEDDQSYGTNWRLIRYADVLLMAAEAYYRSGDEDRARLELNKVRHRATLADITSSGEQLFEDLVRERQLELALEGFRFLDLVRWGRAPQELGSRGFIQGKHEVLPIPNSEIRSAGLSQNPGY